MNQQTRPWHALDQGKSPCWRKYFDKEKRTRLPTSDFDQLLTYRRTR
jgi:hypothetical protein